jgi:hypothetical protein
MTLTNYVERLLDVLKDYLATLLKTCHLHFDYFSNAFFVLFDIADAFVILDDSRNSKVEATEEYSLLDVFYECKDVSVNFQIVDIENITVYKAIANTFSTIAKNFVVKLCSALVNFTILSYVINQIFIKKVHTPHLFIHLWQKMYILRCIVYQSKSKRSSLPKLLIRLHLLIYFILHCIDLAAIFH